MNHHIFNGVTQGKNHVHLKQIYEEQELESPIIIDESQCTISNYKNQSKIFFRISINGIGNHFIIYDF